MRPVTAIPFSSCLNCEKVFSLVDQLSKNMHEFEIFTMEMEFDIKTAKLKSQQVLSNFWQLISTIKSLTIVKTRESGKEVCENPNSTSLVVSLEKSRVKKQNLDNETEPFKSKSKSNSARKRGRPPQSKPTVKPNPNPKPNVTAKRLMELKRAKQLLRTIKCETRDGFYNLFECTKCQRQFSQYSHCLHHIQTLHLNLGFSCPTCSQKYFNKRSLELHIPKCHRLDKFKQIKVFLKNEREKPMNVYVHSHQKQNKTRPTLTSTIKLQNRRGKKDKVFNLSRIKVRNPHPNFSIVKALNVKVVIQRLKMEKSEETSIISQTRTNETSEIETETGKEVSSFKAAKTANEKEYESIPEFST